MSIPQRHGPARRPRWRGRWLALALLAACTADSPPASPGLVLLRQQLRRESRLAISGVHQANDSTLRIVFEEGTRRALRPAERDSLARREASRVVQLWPDPALRRVEVLLIRQVRLGPLTYRSGESRYAFDAASVAPPPSLPGEPRALEIPSPGTATPP